MDQTIEDIIICLIIVGAVFVFVYSIADGNKLSYTATVETNIYSVKVNENSGLKGFFVLGAGYISGNSELQYMFYRQSSSGGKVLDTINAFSTEIVESDDTQPMIVDTVRYTGFKLPFMEPTFTQNLLKSSLHVPVGTIQSKYEL